MSAIAAPAVPVDVALTETAWQPTAALTFEQWAAIGGTLQRMGRAWQWWIGDWILHGAEHYAETYAAAIDTTGLEVQTLSNIASVSRRIPASRRREELSWSHHEAVACLPAAEQDEWLARAIAEGMTVARLRARLHPAAEAAPPPRRAPTHTVNVTLRISAGSDEDAREQVAQLQAMLERRGHATVTRHRVKAL